MGRAVSPGPAVHKDAVKLPDPFCKMLLENIQTVHFLRKPAAAYFCRLCHPGNSRHILCSGAKPLLLISSKENRTDLHFFVYIQQTRPFRAVQFMAADRQKVNSHPFGKDPVFSISLNRIHMKQRLCVFLLYDPRRLFHRLNGSDLIVHIHHGDKDRLPADCFLKGRKRHDPVPVHREICHGKSPVLQMSHGIYHRRMFNGRCDQVLSRPLIGKRRADERQIIGLRTPGSKTDPFLADLQIFCKKRFRFLYIVFRIHPLFMKRRRIPIVLPQNADHLLRHALHTPGRSRIVQICLHCLFLQLKHQNRQDTQPCRLGSQDPFSQ